VQTDISSSLVSDTFSFFIAARSGTANPVVSGRVTVKLGCYGVTSITGTYLTSNPIN